MPIDFFLVEAISTGETGLLMVPVRLDGIDQELRFLVDTGSVFNMLPQRMLEQVSGIEPAGNADVHDASGSSQDEPVYKVPGLKVLAMPGAENCISLIPAYFIARELNDTMPFDDILGWPPEFPIIVVDRPSGTVRIFFYV